MKETIYTLRVFKLSPLTIESEKGCFLSVELKEIWTAPFKDEAALLAIMVDFSGRGFTCKIEKTS